MSIEKKLLGTSPSGDAPNVEDVFSTYLYEGTSAVQTITNGIDLAGEGGMVWIKRRDGSSNEHSLHDTERGATKTIRSNNTDAELTRSGGLTAFNSAGFSVGTYSWENSSGGTHASWTFRKAPRFFDVVTYTGNGTAGREIAHDLGCDVGMILVKNLSYAKSWPVYHRSVNAGAGYLDQSGAFYMTSGQYFWGDNTNVISPTSSAFTVSADRTVNYLNDTYVAYIFAHDPDGEDDDGMIACGSLTNSSGSGMNTRAEIGWEPQFVIFKSTNVSGNWHIMDTMRGAGAEGTAIDARLYPNLSNAEAPGSQVFTPDATGFSTWTNNGDSKIYMAIRAPMMVEPEAGSEVFAVDSSPNSNDPRFISGFPIDMGMQRQRTSSGVDGMDISSRLTAGKYMRTGSTNAEASTSTMDMDYMNGWDDDGDGSTTFISHMFKRAKGFFDCVAYTGNGTAGRTLNHSLSVAPEIMIVKLRSGSGQHWKILHVNSTRQHNLNNDQGGTPGANYFGNGTSYVAPSSTVFTVGAHGSVNTNNATYIAYLFATLAGVSKVGSYTGNGSNQNIACGFSAGARFVLIKRTDSTGDWYVWDTERGIVAGNDPHLSLNSTSAEVTTDDSIDPVSAGFTVNQVSATNINVTSATYIFLAIA